METIGTQKDITPHNHIVVDYVLFEMQGQRENKETTHTKSLLPMCMCRIMLLQFWHGSISDCNIFTICTQMLSILSYIVNECQWFLMSHNHVAKDIWIEANSLHALNAMDQKGIRRICTGLLKKTLPLVGKQQLGELHAWHTSGQMLGVGSGSFLSKIARYGKLFHWIQTLCTFLALGTVQVLIWHGQVTEAWHTYRLECLQKTSS